MKERILEGQKENEKKEINGKNQELLKKQREIYKENEEPQRNSNIKNINLSKIPFEKLKKMAFHYSLKKDKNSIDSKGLECRIGRNSDGVDKKAAIYFSYGIEAVLETWDVWLKWRLNRLNNPKWNEENKELRELIENGQANEEQKNILTKNLRKIYSVIVALFESLALMRYTEIVGIILAIVFIILFIIISVPAIKENSKITKELNG